MYVHDVRPGRIGLDTENCHRFEYLIMDFVDFIVERRQHDDTSTDGQQRAGGSHRDDNAFFLHLTTNLIGRVGRFQVG